MLLYVHLLEGKSQFWLGKSTRICRSFLVESLSGPPPSRQYLCHPPVPRYHQRISPPSWKCHPLGLFGPFGPYSSTKAQKDEIASEAPLSDYHIASNPPNNGLFWPILVEKCAHPPIPPVLPIHRQNLIAQ